MMRPPTAPATVTTRTLFIIVNIRTVPDEEDKALKRRFLRLGQQSLVYDRSTNEIIKKIPTGSVLFTQHQQTGKDMVEH